MTTTRLVLYVDEHWPQVPALPWILLDEAGKRLQEGHSDPRHWPAAARCEVVLGGSQALWLEAELPKAPRREQARLLNYALEEQLAGEPETQHLTVTGKDGTAQGQRLRVLVVERVRLRAVLAQLEAIGRAPSRLVSALQGVPATARRWVLSVAPGGAMQLHGAPPLALPVDGDTLELLLGHAIAQARARNQAPEGLDVLAAAGTTLPRLEAICSALGLAHAAPRPWDWWEAVQLGDDLLHDEFAPRRGKDHWLTRVRAPLLLAAGAVSVYFLVLGGHLLWQKHELGGLDARMGRLFQTALPEVPAVSPAAQLHRELERRRAAAGKLREDDALSLLQAYVEARGTAAGASLRELRYENGRLELGLTALPPEDRDVLLSRLADRGVNARVEGSDPPRLIMIREVHP